MKDINEFENNMIDSDPVQKQYETLPYPFISEKDIKEEQYYYKTNENTIMGYFNSESPDNINHYLHRGNQNFR